MVESKSEDLYSVLATELSRYLHEVKSNAEKDFLSIPSGEISRFGNTLFSNLKKGGVCTFIVTSRKTWDPNTHYYQSLRLAAKRGCRIERIFLLAHKHCRHNNQLHEHITLDENAGIATNIFYVGELISTLSLPQADSLEFGLWDDEICCMSLYKPDGENSITTGWRVSRRKEDIQLLRKTINIFHEKATQISLKDNEQALDLEEPMITTAPITKELADVLCQGDHVSSDNCSWYHSVWQYLRIFNMVSTPTWHHAFYINSFEKLAEKTHFRRVLISGTADYSMFAHVCWGFRNHTQPPLNVSVIDLCETPLFLCKWYSKFIKTSVKTYASDIFSFETKKPFDLITSDAFMTRFSLKIRPKLVSQWHNLLRSKGKVITTMRIEAGASGKAIKATPEQVNSFKHQAHQEAVRWSGLLGHPPLAIANSAKIYAERMTSYSFGSKEEILKLFKENGFNITSFDLIDVPGEMASTRYAQIIAEKF